MYKNKYIDNKNNICGVKIAKLRKALTPKVSQRALAEKLQLNGLDVDKNVIQRIESGERFVTDIELRVLSETFNISADELLKDEPKSEK